MYQSGNAAHDLLNKTLSTGWKVIEEVKKQDGQTGAFFSVCYKVQKDTEIAFLKVFDFQQFFKIARPGHPIVEIMTTMLNAYEFEKNLSRMCQEHHVTKVAFVKEAGEENIPGYAIPIVPYLIFDLAEGDIRKKLKLSDKLDDAWKLKSLHDVAVGIKQLHSIQVSHQDLKPSNILVFGEDSKIGDLGRSVSQKLRAPHDVLPFAGGLSYRPPEFLYRYFSSDWANRTYAADCYLFGNLIVFYFSGASIIALLKKYIPKSLTWDEWRGTDLSQIRDYLIKAHELAIVEFGQNISDEYLRSELKTIVYYLCHPIPEERGHPKNIANTTNNYHMERFISKLDFLYRMTKYTLKREFGNG